MSTVKGRPRLPYKSILLYWMGFVKDKPAWISHFEKRVQTSGTAGFR